MAATTSPATQPNERTLVITRVFDAPRELVTPACRVELEIVGNDLQLT